MKKKKSKILIIGLPKSGTSTLATMFRILGYKVTGPTRFSSKRELLDVAENNHVFQDYPWCFEYPYILNKLDMKVIVLERNAKEWSESFIKNYGNDGDDYLSFRYMKLSKSQPKLDFVDYHDQFYSNCRSFLSLNGIEFLNLKLSNLKWSTLCEFLDEPIPKTLMGKTSGIPRVNSNNLYKRNNTYEIIKKIKKLLIYFLGQNYNKITSFIYRNKS